MRKLVESTFVTLDGVIGDTDPSSAPGAAPEIWGAPYWDDEHGSYAHDMLFSSDALLLGRITFEAFAVAWPDREFEFAERINAMPKYVASRTLVGPLGWNGTLLEGDVVEAVAALKAQPGGNILKYGSGELSRTLMRHNLIDEFHFWHFPVAVGGGQRLLEGVDTTHLELINSTPFRSGIVVHTYRPKAIV